VGLHDVCDGYTMLARGGDVALYVDLGVDDGGYPRRVVAE
jgi:hypothetical protein